MTRGAHRTLAVVGLALLAGFLFLATVGRLHGSPTALVTAGAEAPSPAHPFGTDTLGRDLLARTADASWLSLCIAAGAVLVPPLVAVPLGVYAGSHHGRRTDELVSRTLEVFQALPSFVLVVFLLGLVQGHALDVGPVTITTNLRVALALAIGFVPFFARVTRAATVAEMHQDYVEGLIGLGVTRRELLTREVLVNVAPAVGVQAVLALAIAIFAEGGLSFLGLGVAPPDATLGNLIADAGPQLLDGPWWYAIIPGLVMVVGILGCNLVADAFHDAAVSGDRPAVAP
jgi:peptide/nickel transport system permease protein